MVDYMEWAHDHGHRPIWNGRIVTLGFFIPSPLR